MLIVGGCGILLLTKLGGYLFDQWTAGAPFYIMAILNLIAFIAAIIVILIDRATPKIQLGDENEEPLLSDPEDEP
jgi:F0F1-type ATP synthase assembly protein I